jgi:hypothetical protein
MTKWEVVSAPHDDDVTDRLVVPGGWIYRTSTYGDRSVALVFVPDPAVEYPVTILPPRSGVRRS